MSQPKEATETLPEKALESDSVANSSLRYTGYSYILGDLALFAHGLINKRPDRALAGLGWSVGAFVAAFYGQTPPEQRMRAAAYDIADHFAKCQIEVPVSAGLHRQYLHHRSDLQTKIEDFLYRYPSQILNTTYVAGGVGLICAGLGRNHKDVWEAASGAFALVGGIAGLAIPEHHSDAPSTTTPLTPQWFIEKPLRLTAAMYVGHDLTLLQSAMHERGQPGSTRGYQLKLFTVGCYLLGELFLSMSSKKSDQITLSESATDRLLNMAVEVIRSQPENQQDVIVTELSAYLNDHPDVTLDTQQLLDTLHSKLQAKSAPLPPTSQIAAPAQLEPQPELPARKAR
jgi:hypothetical protein